MFQCLSARRVKDAARCAKALGLLLALTAATSSESDTLIELRDADLRLAAIANRLIIANAPLCDRKMPATGMLIHAMDQYSPAARAAARSFLGLETPVAVEGVVPGSPADRAGIQVGDGIKAINGRSVNAHSDEQSSATRDATEKLIASLPLAVPITLVLQRGGQHVQKELRALPACRIRFEVIWGSKVPALTDGDTIQISNKFMTNWTDEDLAAIFAHELAHTVLEHRSRLEAAGVKNGVLGGLGRSGRLNRQTEDEADQLSIHLLHNASLEPEAAVRFWQKLAGQSGWRLHLRHSAPAARAKAMSAELKHLPDKGATSIPAILKRRNEPLN